MGCYGPHGDLNPKKCAADSLDFDLRVYPVPSGAPNAGNYCAANAFLDTFAAYRRQMDLPAVSVQWGPWAEAGASGWDGENERRSSTQVLKYPLLSTQDGKDGMIYLQFLILDYGCLWDYQWIHDGRIGRYG